MDDTLAAICTADLNATARLLAVYVYANADDDGYAELELTDLCAAIGVGPAKLRTYRAQLATAGYMASRLADGVLRVQLEPTYAAGKRAATARVGADLRVGPDQNRAATARSAAESAPLGRDRAEKRAATARSEPESAPLRRGHSVAERASRAPVIGIVNNNNNNSLRVVVQGGMQGGDRTAALLRAAGVRASLADRFARDLSLESAARHVAAWQSARRANPDLSAGALVARLREWDIPRAVDAHELRAGVLADHVTDDDLRSWGVAARTPLSGYEVPAGYEHLIKH